jgi:hypothetical protein
MAAELEKLRLWTPAKCVLGKMWKISGLRARNAVKNRRFRLDWLLIELENPERFTEEERFVNTLPTYDLNMTRQLTYVAAAARVAGVAGVHDAKEVSGAKRVHCGQHSSSVYMPLSLKRGLTFEELFHKQAAAEEDDNNYVVWKFGRTSHFTFGIVSSILSDYRCEDGFVTDELMVKDYIKRGSHAIFSKRGDSGSLVWDYDGHISSLFWGGKEEIFVNYVTPIQYVLEDIQQVCNAKEVSLLVRQEDYTKAVFSYIGK